MDLKKMETDNVSVPLYTKIGWALAWVVMLGLLLMILRNCGTSIFYGLQTDQQTVDSYYQLGVRDGRSGKNEALEGAAKENSVLRKAYVKGYREGRDRGRNGAEQGH